MRAYKDSMSLNKGEKLDQKLQSSNWVQPNLKTYNQRHNQTKV